VKALSVSHLLFRGKASTVRRWSDYPILGSANQSKSEQKRGRGAAHANTVRGVRQYDGGDRVLHERRPIHRLRQSDLGEFLTRR